MILLLLFLIAMQTPKPKNTLCACTDIFYGASQQGMPLNLKIFVSHIFWFKIWRMALIHKKFCVIKFPKIDEKVFYNRWIGVWTKSKNEYFLEIYITQAFY